MTVVYIGRSPDGQAFTLETAIPSLAEGAPGAVLWRAAATDISTRRPIVVSGVIVRSCRVCGCTDEFACDGGCEWVEADLCSHCVEEDLPLLARWGAR
jgi:hypothetical protein